MILRTQGLVKSFGGFRAVDSVDLSVKEGAIHALIGPNGAGKTTLFYLLTGYVSPTIGSVQFKGREIAGLPAHIVARAGIVCTFQITHIFVRLTAVECVTCAILARTGRAGAFWGSLGQELRDEAMELLAVVGIPDLADQRSGTLSHGDQRLLEIAIALAARPSMLLLDEPTAGMSPVETERTIDLVRILARERGLTVLLVEHDVNVVFAVSDRITVLHRGRILKEGTPEQIRRDPEVVEVYLGAPV